jgi:hypothetical protein
MCGQEFVLIRLEIFHGCVDHVVGLLRLGKNYTEKPIGFVEHGRLQRLDRQGAGNCDQQLRLRRSFAIAARLSGRSKKAPQLLHAAIGANKQQFQIITTETADCAG